MEQKNFKKNSFLPQQEGLSADWIELGLNDFSKKINTEYNKVVPKKLREEKNMDKKKEKSFWKWVKKFLKKNNGKKGKVIRGEI